MVFWKHKTELFCSFSLIEVIDIVVNSIYDDVWEAEYERTGALNDVVDGWGWICF